MYKSEIIFHWIDVLSSFSCCRGEGGGGAGGGGNCAGVLGIVQGFDE